MVVLHHTAMASAKAAIARLCDPRSEVSAHYVICEPGRIYQLVDEKMRAWHAGAGQWGKLGDVNSHSIGIELANGGPQAGLPPFPEPQMAALEALLAAVLGRWHIAPERVIGHSDMAISRKSDPGAKFDWWRLARQGLSVWPDDMAGTSRPDPGRFRANCTTIGYDPDAAPAPLLAAFRLRFRAGFDGPLDGRDMAIAKNLAQRFPVDRHIRNP